MRVVHLSTALASLLCLGIACGDKDSDSGGPEGPADEDGDGFNTDEDCDDSDASVNPEAEEVWYDGVDADCAGDDDYDADADGVRGTDGGGADCDDTDPNVNPGASETWYDGVDGDCKGDDDYDADIDGHQSAEHIDGGTDCDDTNPTSFPNASDDWYDGVDSDCAGDSDFDADGDGQDWDEFGGTDCDDDDPAVYQGGEDTWYDGVDSDCMGDSDYDQDQDGYDNEENGGLDCEDTDPESFPGADEQLDGHDTNCDAQPDDFSLGDDWGGAYIEGLTPDGALGLAMAIGDIDGDGQGDVAYSQGADTTSAEGLGFVQVHLGGTLNTLNTSASATYTIWAGEGTEDAPVNTVQFIHDIDGDGSPELALAASLAGPSGTALGGQVGIFTLDQLDQALTDGTDLELMDADRTISGFTDFGGIGDTLASIPDINGDGLNELMLNGSEPGGVLVFLGGSLAGSGFYSDDDDDLRWTTSEPLSGGLVGTGDLTGDGLDDVGIGHPGHDEGRGIVYIMAGDAVPVDADLDADAWATIQGDSSGDRAGASVASGDFNGDGGPDLAVGAPNDNSQTGTVAVVSGADLVAGSQSLGTTDFVTYAGVDYLGQAGDTLLAADFNADGSDDLLVGAPGSADGIPMAGSLFMVLSGNSGNRSLAQADVRIRGNTSGDAFGTQVVVGDLNGDGAPDIGATAHGEDAVFGDEGAVYLGYNGF